MNKIWSTMISFLLMLIAATFLSAQSAEFDRDIRNQRVGERDQQGNFERAVSAARKAIEVAEANLGSDHPFVAISLDNLALLYRNQGEYVEAEPLYRRSLAIWEKTLGPDHPYVANCLKNLSELYHAMGKDREALDVDKRIERLNDTYNR